MSSWDGIWQPCVAARLHLSTIACLPFDRTQATPPAAYIRPCKLDTLSVLHTADANILINSCRLAAQQYTYTYQEPIPVEQLVRALCDQKQASGAALHACVVKSMNGLNTEPDMFTCHMSETGRGRLMTCMWHRIAGVHTVWWAEAFRGVAAVWGLGQD